MKYIKLFAVALVATFVASCNDDDDFSVNTSKTVAGFEKTTMRTKESAGIINIPITVEGKRNGDISFEISAQGTGENPAVEGKHFVITEKNIKLLEKNDTTSSTTVNVQFQCLDDDVINEPREVTLTIKASNGVELQNKQIVVTLRDNDAAFYEKFQGKWTLTGMTSGDKDGDPDKEFSKEIVIKGAIDEEDTNYDHILTISAPALFNVGVSLNCEWPLEYTYDKETKTGTLSHLMNKGTVASYGSAYQWIFVTDDGANLSGAPVTAEWALGEGDTFPTEVSWEMESDDEPYRWIYLYQPGAGYWDYMYNLKISK